MKKQKTNVGVYYDAYTLDPNNKNKGDITVSCLPESQIRTDVSYYVGILCRALVAAMAVFGLSLFICDAFVIVEEVVPFTAVLWPSLIFTFAVAVISLNVYTAIGGIILTIGGVFLWLYLQSKDVFGLLWASVRIFYNAAVERFAFAGLAEISSFKLSSDYGGFDTQTLMTVGAAFFTLVISLLFAPAIIKKVRLFYLAFVGTVFIIPIVSYNIIRDNWGFAVLVSALTAILTLRLFEKQYIIPSAKKIICKDVMSIVSSGSFTEISKDDGEEKTDAKKKADALKFPQIKRRRGKDTDIEAALRLETPSARKNRIRLEKKLKKESRKEEKKLLRLEKRDYKEKKKIPHGVVYENAALGGAVGLTAFICAFALIFLPTQFIKKNETGIPYLGRAMDKARVYVTAFLMGDELDLNNVSSLEKNGRNSGPRSTVADYPKYQDIKIGVVEAPYNTPVYLRTWIGTTYGDDQWTSATLDDVKEYRGVFGEDFTPEMISESFYEAIYPKFDEFSVNSGYKDNLKLGFITERVNVKRTYSNGMLLFMPSTVLPSHGLMQYDSLDSSFLPHDAYFDGIWSSKYFIEGTSYSTVSNVTSMKSPMLGSVLYNNIRYYDHSMEYIIDGRADRAVTDDERTLVIEGYESQLEALGIQYNGESLLSRYYKMSDAEKQKLIADYNTELKYRDYVRETYTQTDYADNDTIKQLAKDIIGSAMAEGSSLSEVSYRELFESGDISEEYYHAITIALVKYLSENMEYSITAPAIEVEYPDSLSAVEIFLTESKTGYCVQYASSLALMLRSIGIPARFCEGYIVSEYGTDFFGNDNPITRYKAEVLDSDAHAWVEVYYDSLGWVQYEATKPYLDGMYGTEQPEVEDLGGDIDIAPKDPIEVEIPDDDEEVIIDVDEPISKVIKRVVITVLICAAILFVLVIIVTTVFTIILGNKAKKERDKLITRTYVLKEPSEEDKRKIINGIFDIYEALDLSPMTGELQTEYAERLANSIGDVSLTNPQDILTYISKEEFGYGMSVEETAILGAYYRELTTAVYNGLDFFNKIDFRYLKRIV